MEEKAISPGQKAFGKTMAKVKRQKAKVKKLQKSEEEGSWQSQGKSLKFKVQSLKYDKALHCEKALEVLRLGNWNLEFGICLGFGACDLEFKSYYCFFSSRKP